MRNLNPKTPKPPKTAKTPKTPQKPPKTPKTLNKYLGVLLHSCIGALRPQTSNFAALTMQNGVGGLGVQGLGFRGLGFLGFRV